MKYHNVFFIIFWLSTMSYSIYGQNTIHKNDINFSDVELELINSTVDSLLLTVTGEQRLEYAYALFFKDPDYYYEKTSFDSDIHTLFIDNQFQVLFSIWKLDWVINSCYERIIWLSINKEGGEYWKYMQMNSEKMSPIFTKIYKATIEEDPEYGFTIACDNNSLLHFKNEIEKSLLVVLLITWTVNST